MPINPCTVYPNVYARHLRHSVLHLIVMSERPPRVLVVCLGNICRSPMGEAVLEKISKERNIAIDADSAGTSREHEGDRPHHLFSPLAEILGPY